MFFNSFEYLIFLPLVFLIYWFVVSKNLTVQNSFILFSSYFFYGWWNWKFLFLLLFSTLLDYFFGLILGRKSSYRKFFLWLSIINNLGVLAIFKYYNFFISEITLLLSQTSLNFHPYLLEIALPVGISFYTFHGMSYVFDIYRDKITPEKNFVNYAVFVSFFPLLVAGPIERASHLLPQIKRVRLFNYDQAVSGIHLIIWGLFKKVVIADNIGQVANRIFENYDTYSGLTLILGAIIFSFQIYGDFSGYSDIALGTAKLFGFELLSNFRFPYFSRDIAEFWRRWHISLSSWFKDYLYIPLGGSKNGKWLAIRNTFIIFIISGFWHGSNWNFIIWGGVHASMFLPLLIFNKNRKHVNEVVAFDRLFPTYKELFQILVTFLLVSFAWIFFRSPSLTVSIGYIKNIFIKISEPIDIQSGVISSSRWILLFVVLEWFQRRDERNIYLPESKIFKRAIYISICYAIWLFSINEGGSEFIYFQF